MNYLKLARANIRSPLYSLTTLKGKRKAHLSIIRTMSLLFFMMAFSTLSLSAQTEVQTTIISFFNDWIIPIGEVVVHICVFGGIILTAINAFTGNPIWKKYLFGTIIGAIIFYRGGYLLLDLFSSFGSSYTIG